MAQKNSIRLILIIIIITTLFYNAHVLSGTDTYIYYDESLEKMELIAQEDYEVQPEDIKKLETMSDELKDTSYIDLIVKNRMLLLLAQEKTDYLYSPAKRTEISEMIKNEQLQNKVKNRQKKIKKITFTTAVVSIGLFNLFWYMADITHDKYNSASSAESAADLRNTTEALNALSYICGGTGVISLGVSIYLFSKELPKKKIE